MWWINLLSLIVKSALVMVFFVWSVNLLNIGMDSEEKSVRRIATGLGMFVMFLGVVLVYVLS